MAFQPTIQSMAGPKMYHTQANNHQWSPRNEHMRSPRENALPRPLIVASRQPFIILPRVPPPSRRASSEGSQGPPSPQIVEWQASAGASETVGDGRPRKLEGPHNKPPHETNPHERQSEDSNVLEYYLRDHTQTRKAPLPNTSNVRVQDVPTDSFDFGLEDVSDKVSYRELVTATPAAISGSSDRAETADAAPHAVTYSLFPSSTRRPSTGHAPRPSCLHYHGSEVTQHGALPAGISIDPTRPRKASLPLSVRSRADSCTSTRLPPSAKMNSGVPGSPLAEGFPQRPVPLRVSSNIPIAPPSVQEAREAMPTRWSGDTTTPFSDTTSIKERRSTSSVAYTPWPSTGSFFENDEDDDEEVPLRRKVVTRIRGARAWSASTGTSDSTVIARRQRKGWSHWVLCCSGRKSS